MLAGLHVASKILPALPERAVLVLSDVCGTVGWAVDRRGRRAGMQGLAAVFGEEMTPRDRRRTLRASYRNTTQAVVLLFHLQPLTDERYRKFVHITPEDDAKFRRLVAEQPTFVLVSGHYGNWELTLCSRSVVPYAPPMAYLAETTGSPRVDAFFERLRDHGSGGANQRKGGAMALRGALEKGQSVCFLVDRNVPRRHGGRCAPFLGLSSRTTPLAATLAHWYQVPARGGAAAAGGPGPLAAVDLRRPDGAPLRRPRGRHRRGHRAHERRALARDPRASRGVGLDAQALEEPPDARNWGPIRRTACTTPTESTSPPGGRMPFAPTKRGGRPRRSNHHRGSAAPRRAHAGGHPRRTAMRGVGGPQKGARDAPRRGLGHPGVGGAGAREYQGTHADDWTGGGGDGTLRSGRHLGPWGTHMPDDRVSPLPDRQSVRMRGFDYAKDGAYFITICTADRRCTLGSVDGRQAHAVRPGHDRDGGVDEDRRRAVRDPLDAFVVMPNHVHGIVWIGDGALADDRGTDRPRRAARARGRCPPSSRDSRAP